MQSSAPAATAVLVVKEGLGGIQIEDNNDEAVRLLIQNLRGVTVRYTLAVKTVPVIAVQLMLTSI